MHMDLLFFTGPGVVVENKDFLSRERGEVIISFDNGLRGLFSAVAAEKLVTVL